MRSIPLVVSRVSLPRLERQEDVEAPVLEKWWTSQLRSDGCMLCGNMFLFQSNTGWMGSHGHMLAGNSSFLLEELKIFIKGTAPGLEKHLVFL